MKSELQNKLNENIPAEAVEKREAYKNGPMLSYLSGAYVINRLNEVLGQGNWGYTIKNLNKVHEGVIQQYSGEVFTVSYITTLGFWALIDGKGASFDEVGYGDGTDKKSQGKAHELATKESVTDALKRAAKNLGISMGLGLYFKSEEFVNEEVSQVREPVKQIKAQPAAKQEIKTPAQPIVLASGNSETSGGSTNTKAPTQKIMEKDTSIKRQSIKSYYLVLKSKGVITQPDFVKKYLSGKTVDTLSNDEVNLVLTTIKTDFKGELSL